MSYIHLTRRSSLHRQPDGSTSIGVGNGEALRFGPGFAAMIDELRSGIPASEWKLRLGTDPMAARVDLALSEHRLLEQATSVPPLMPQSGHRSGGKCTLATWRLHCTSTLLAGSTAAVLAICLVPVDSLRPLPWWSWSAFPFVLAAMALLHETGHYVAARLHRQDARILMFHNGQLQARCVIADDVRHRTTAGTLRILAAGPLTDGALLVATAATTRAFALHPLAAVTMVCALAGLLLNLMPGKRSDYAKMLALAPRDRPASEAIGWFVVSMLGVLALAYLATLTGLTRH